MPRGDRTGPVGMGPLTGRGVGYCSGSGTSDFATPGSGRWFGRGCGRGNERWGDGRGRRHMGYAFGMPGWMRYGSGRMDPVPGPSPEFEKQELKAHAEVLQRQIDEVNKRLDELSKR